MPWVRIDENAMDHPKFLAISANAWRLWCEGAAYCQKHLTDGLIPRAALKGFRYYSPAALKQLTAELVPGKGPLWRDTAAGVSVHDYLDYNDSREAVLAARAKGKERKRRFNEKHASANAPENALPDSGRTTDVSRSVVGSLRQELSVEREGGAGETAQQRAGNFCEWYADTHSRLIGVGYIGNPRKDYESTLLMVAKFTDAELRDAALVWFGMDDDFATSGTRTIPKFASRVSKCVQLARSVA